ncbi:MAG: hypothetical protein P1U78_10675 [Alcanivoracaceae bacterium]|nr:hypothetical protein [Alcanivoracaceae bacterium]
MKFFLALFLLCCALTPLSHAGEQRALQHTVITLTPAELPDLEGLPIDSLSVMVWSGERFVPVPFQLDEMDRLDMVWFADSGFERRGTKGAFDGADQLLLMLRDAASAAAKDAQPEHGKIVAQVNLDTPEGIAYVFYVVQGNSQRDPRSYVSHDPNSGVTSTEHYVLTTDPDNELNWRHLGYSGYTGRADASLIDTLKMRMSGGVLFRFPRITLDNDNLRPVMTGFRIGPIRSVMHLETRVVFASLPMMKLHVQAHRYANHYEAHSYAKIPSLYRSALKQPQVSVSIDGNGLMGSLVRTARAGDLVAKVDGSMDASEEQMVRRGLSSDDSWILFDSRQGFALLTELDVPPSLHGIPLGLVYQDDRQLSVRPEQYPGQLPNLGYELNGWPEQDELRFAVRLLFDQHFGELEPTDYVALRTGRALKISVFYPQEAQ